MVRTCQKYKAINEIMADNSEVSSNLPPTITVEGLTKMIAAMRTSTEMMTTMRTSLLELQTEVANIKQQLSTTAVHPWNGTNAVAMPTMSTLRLRCSTFDGTDLEIWINEVVSFMNFHHVPREQWVIVATFYLGKEAKRWYNWLKTQINPITWQSFTESLLARFGPTAFEDHFIQLMHL
eukprot:TRINITY_DN10663_c0_g3_i5.p1 TRINITY_DN10663_c0_g3~~TRINITY_DN10663_c0_g3_i5.p1  ORF type:complete len:179 (-),score=14.87 TRINITY_DN10663_c0_g3_i5:2320-2856(-)